MNVVAIIQARMGSTRLPSKIMMDLCGKPVLKHVIERVRRVERINQVVVATTTEESDDKVFEFCVNENIQVFRGSQNDVLSRYYHAAKAYHADTVIRITSDCPMIDVDVINQMLDAYQNREFQFVTNAGPDLEKRTFPRGLDVEIFDAVLLEKAFFDAKLDCEREHVTPYLYEHCDSVHYYMNAVNDSNHRWTLDTTEDFDLINRIYKVLYNPNQYFGMDDVLSVLREHPEWTQINAHIEQKKYTLNPTIHYRDATLNDCDLFFKWSNDPLVRKNAFSNETIDYTEHCNWYKSKMESSTVHMVVFFEEEHPVGQLRLELIQKEIVISYSVDGGFRGKGFGTHILKMAHKIAVEYFGENIDTLGKVKKNNDVSRRAFISAGYREFEEELCYIYRWSEGE